MPPVAASAYPPPRYAWYVVFVLLLALTVSFIDRQILSLMVQPVRAALGISDTQISLVHGAAFTLFYVFLGVPLGRLADHGHRQRMIVAGIVIWSLATISCGFATSFSTLFASRVMVGVGEATLSPAAYSLIADYFAPDRRARAMGIYSLGPIVGSGLALILGGQVVAATAHAGAVLLPLVGRVAGWQAAFVFVGLPGLLVALLLATIREPVRHERLGGDSAGVAATLAFMRSRATPLLLIPVGISLGGSVVAFGFGAWLPTAFIRLHGWSAPQIASAMGAILLFCGIPGAVWSGFLADRMVARGRPDAALTLSVIGVAALIPAVPIVALSANPWIALAAFAWVNFFLGLPTALIMPALQAITPNEFRGQVAAFDILTVTIIGFGVGPTMIALATDKLFGSDLAVGKSIALVITLSAAIGLALLIAARRSYPYYLEIMNRRHP